MNDKFHRFFADRYPNVRSKFPGEGRRRWKLRVMEELWLEPEAQAEISSAALNSQDTPGDAAYEKDGDPMDVITDCEEVGLVIRTDFSNDDAWNAFVSKLKDAEKELLGSMMQAQDTTNQDDNDIEMKEEESRDSESESDATPDHIIRLVANANDPLFNGISNIAALRLLNDVGIRLAPAPPAGTKRISPSNRLIDRNKLQEIYSGKTIWIYDGQSNSDESVRLVSQQGDVYGTATADSWRARASHVPELQFNMSAYNMKIDFGGLDRWDYSERLKNLEEAEPKQ
ncbi:hypothetical protein NP233_g7339 [Leucocoprinus birnbaumii]|uniref:Uncharacterized protein n=1 Tax=Leucocoprinus birnbaumii TaxID=56174 RepID=A0AAD5YUP7_9AGAR|nr:hypothetical protein NP233_g7339 [Leucocoprinus birnbaumii]